MSKAGSGTLYLAKSSNEGVCHCECEEAIMAWPVQLDCPWCGCGWLFTCMECRKVFTFARVVELKESLHDLAKLDHAKAAAAGEVEDGGEEDPDELDTAVEFMQSMLADLEDEATYVYFDGFVIATYYDELLQQEGEEPLEIVGMHRDHALTRVPQVQMMDEPELVENNGWLVDPEYWGPPRVDDDDDAQD